MPMHQAISLFVAALAIAGIAAFVVRSERSALSRLTVSIVILAMAGAASGLSALVAYTRHSGTGFTTSFGWPKPFYFHYLDEAGRRSEGWSVVYFLGNSLVFAAVLLILWTAWRLVRR